MTTIYAPDWARLQWAARHPDETIRSWAASWLGARLNPMGCTAYGDARLPMRDLALALLADESPDVLSAALRTLREVPALALPDPVWAAYQRLSSAGRCEQEQMQCLGLLAELQDERILEVVARTGPLDLPLSPRLHLLGMLGTPAALALLREQMARAGSEVDCWPQVAECRNLAGAELFWSFLWDRAGRIAVPQIKRFIEWMSLAGPDLDPFQPAAGGAAQGLDGLPREVPVGELIDRCTALLAPLRPVLDDCLDPTARRAAGLVLGLRAEQLSAVPESQRAMIAVLVRVATRRALLLSALPSPEAAGPAVRLELLLSGRCAPPDGGTRVSQECRAQLLHELWMLPPEATRGLVGRCRAALDLTGAGPALETKLAGLLLGSWQVCEPAIVARIWDLVPADRDLARVMGLMGAVTADRVQAELRSPDPDWGRVCAVLMELDQQWGAPLWAAHLGQILGQVDWYDAAAALQRLSFAEVVPALQEALRPGEARMYLVYKWLCVLHGIEAVEMPRLPQDSPWLLQYEGPSETDRNEGPPAPDEPRPLEAADRAGRPGQGPPSGGLWVTTRCAAPGCGRTYHYYVRRICFDVDGYKRIGGPEIVDRVRCKGCGAIDRAQVTQRGCSELLDLLEGERVPMPSRGRTSHIGPIMLCYRDPGAPGLVARLRELEQIVATRPQDAAARLALGNVLWAAGREADSEAAYRDAVRVDPSAVEGWYLLSQISARREDTMATVRLGETLLAVEKPSLYDMQRERWDAIRQSVSGWVRELRQSGILRGGRRAGPKDPCPCGSGRRYKSCCLPRDRAMYEQQPT